MYPNMESKVNAQLAKTGTFFQSYIRRGLANLEAEANAASSGGSATSSISGLSGFTGSSASPTVRAREIVDAAVRKRESVMSTAGAESSGVADPSESYKDRLARLQQMFGYKSVRNSSNWDILLDLDRNELFSHAFSALIVLFS
jgi:hypothetical protein